MASHQIALECEHCKRVFSGVSKYLSHQNVSHALEKNCRYICPFKNCKAACATVNSLKTHFSRDHKQLKRTMPHDVHANVSFKCTRAICGVKFSTSADFEKHLRAHMRANEKVLCPFDSCKAEFIKAGSYAVHKHRFHQNKNLQPSANIDEFEQSDLCNDFCADESEPMEVLEDDFAAEVHQDANFARDCFMRTANFFMKLDAEKLVPLSTIQIVADELIHLTSFFHKILMAQVKIELNKISDWQADKDILITKITNIVEKSNYMHEILCKNEYDRSVSFDTIHNRNKIFSKYFDILQPKEYFLGVDKLTKKPATMQYVSIESTLKKLLKNKKFLDFARKSNNTRSEKEADVICDYDNGKVYKSHAIPEENKMYLDILLYQDEAEISNPLGSAKGKHKITGTYFTLGNIPPQYRSRLESIFLISLCKSKYIKMFGKDACLEKLVSELTVLENTGISIDEITIFPKLIYCLGDNLGSNAIGGFTTNFSILKSHFCRYCEITLSEFKQNPLKASKMRTINEYNRIITKVEKIDKKNLKAHQVDLKKKQQQLLSANVPANSNKKSKTIAAPKKVIIKGIKTRSPLNKLSNFHVCSLGLPPCIAHDLLEGVVNYDLCLILKNIISKKKWLTLDYLNEKLSTFKFGEGRNICRPVPIKDRFKSLGGSASQNWALLRFLSLIISNKIKDPNDEAWILYLLLKEITEICFSPKISMRQLKILKEKIDEYIERRSSYFHKVPLRPKHHFLVHYPDLFVQFGPLVKLWTLRFESKHSYFKNIARMCKNFRNITKTLAVKHQKLFSYTLGGNFLETKTYWTQSQNLNLSIYKDVDIVNLLSCPKYHNSQESGRVFIHGTEYRVNDWLLLEINADESNWKIGKIKLFVIDRRGDINILLSVYSCSKDMHYGTLMIDKQHFGETYEIKTAASFIDYYPLDAFEIDGNLHVVLKHAIM